MDRFYQELGIGLHTERRPLRISLRLQEYEDDRLNQTLRSFDFTRKVLPRKRKASEITISLFIHVLVFQELDGRTSHNNLLCRNLTSATLGWQAADRKDF